MTLPKQYAWLAKEGSPRLATGSTLQVTPAAALSDSTGTINAVQISPSFGAFDAGTIRFYGVQ